MSKQFSASRIEEGILHPISLGAIAVLILNDHWWKPTFGGPITGKLSDVAGLTFFPLLLQAVWEIASSASRRTRPPSRAALLIAVAMTGIAFTLVKTWSPAAEAYRVGLGYLQWPVRAVLQTVRGLGLPPVGRVALARDPADLFTLPALGWPLWNVWRPTRRLAPRRPDSPWSSANTNP